MVIEKAFRMAIGSCTEYSTWLCKMPLVGRLGGRNGGLYSQVSNAIRPRSFQRMFNIYNRHQRSGWCHSHRRESLLTSASVGGVTSSVTLRSESPHSTEVLAAYFASVSLSPGDCYLLYGNVGAGKSLFRWVDSVLKDGSSGVVATEI